MTFRFRTRLIVAAIAMLATTMAGCSTPAPATGHVEGAASQATAGLLRYLREHRTTGFIVIQNGKVLVNEAWPAPAGDAAFANFVYGRADGYLLEDVASLQKSFVALLAAIAVDKGMLDVNQPASTYLGKGWSKSSPDNEARIRVIDILTMSSGLDENFAFRAGPGTTFFYNTPVYALMKTIVATAAKAPLETITHDWLTAPLGMTETAWRKRPSALASVGNETGLVTTPADLARIGLMVLNRGVSETGVRVVSEAQLAATFERSATNPAYGRLWWLNGGAYTVRAGADRKNGPLIEAAPADTVAAFGALDRRLYVVPSRNLVVVRTGATTNDPTFDQNLWIRLMQVLG